MDESLYLLERSVNYQFCDKQLLVQALTHPSCGVAYNYERLEFLGDAVLELMVSDLLYKKYRKFSEGLLTQKRAEIVCAKSLAEIARAIDLGTYIFLGKGEENTDGRNKTSILENAMEAILGAIYLDGGYEPAMQTVEMLFGNAILEAEGKSDYKSQLQESVQKTTRQDIVYTVDKQEGPPHNVTFYVNLSIGGKTICAGSGLSKKEAEQDAAKTAIKILELDK